MKYKTQMEAARNGAVTKELAQVASDEGIAEHELLPLVASGQVVIPANILHKSLYPHGIGRGLRTMNRILDGMDVELSEEKTTNRG